VTKPAAATSFIIEQTEYGWSVWAGAKRLGLFSTQRHAIGDVKRRRAALKAKGQRSTLVVGGSDTPPVDK
jgi:hypothetical protein